MPHVQLLYGRALATSRILSHTGGCIYGVFSPSRGLAAAFPWRTQIRGRRKPRSASQKRAIATASTSSKRKDEVRPGSDPGSWAFSPEWFGTQGGNWGRDSGEIAFEQQSHHGNGLVRVTCHPASKHDPIPIHATAACPEEASQLEQEQQHHSNASHSSREFQEWRVLRFNEETVQSVARVSVGSSRSTEASVQQRPDCMAFLYMKTIGAAVASLVGLAPQGSSLGSALERRPAQPCRVLCIGLGGGTLPLFLAHHFPGMVIDVVEIDPVVIAAAQGAMGFPKHRARLHVHEADAIGWLRSRCASGAPPLDLVFVDAFDGNNNVPEAFTDAGDPFMTDLAASLHPEHGAAVVNLHRGGLPGIWKQLLMKMAGEVWMDPFVTPVAEVYKRVVLPKGHGRTYMLGVGKQYNTIVVSARGQHLEVLPDFERHLQKAASNVSHAAKMRFKVERRATLDFREL